MEVPKTPEASILIGRFSDLVSQGFNSNEIRSQLRGEGFKFSNSIASSIYKSIVNPNPLDIRFTPANEYPNPESFNTSAIPLSGQYGYLVATTAIDSVTGLAVQGIHMVYMDELGTIDQIKDNAMYILDERYYQGSATVVMVDIINAYTE